jgi:hypothetical protein
MRLNHIFRHLTTISFSAPAEIDQGRQRVEFKFQISNFKFQEEEKEEEVEDKFQISNLKFQLEEMDIL